MERGDGMDMLNEGENINKIRIALVTTKKKNK
jgi:hypothetical protein